MQVDQRTSLAWIATVVIVALCLWPKAWMPVREKTASAPRHTDKVIHFAMFAAYGILWTRGRTPTPKRAAAVFAGAVVLAVATELLQGLPVISRDPDPLDALADVVGGFMGIALVSAAGGVVEVDPVPDDA